MKKKLLTTILVSTLVMQSLVGCGSSKESVATEEETVEESVETEEATEEPTEESTETEESIAGDTLTKCKESGSIVIGFANEVPYAYEDENGELKGEAVDIAKACLANMGITDVQGELVEFSALIPGLQAERFDMITAGMSVTAERAKEVLFCKPEISYGEAVLVAEGNPKNIKSYADIAADPSIIAAVPGGVIEYDYLTGSGVAESQISIVNDLSSAIQTLQTGRCDVVCASNTALSSALETTGSDGVELVGDFEQTVINGASTIMYGASAVRLGNEDFIEAFNAELEKLEESGELLKILEENGFNEYNLPNGITVEEVISQ